MKTVSSLLLLGSLLPGFASSEASASEAQAPRVEAQAQQAGTLTGTVKDTKGEPIIGASILVKGSGKGVLTDPKGHFSLKGVKPGAEVTSSAGQVLLWRSY